jgi:parallel beta-helix repeat protein
LYVGGTGPGNYTKIQDAINDSLDGDKIFVYAYSSPYFENIILDKSIDLKGEDKNTTIIDGKGNDIVLINANYASMSGFTIQNGENAVILISCSDAIISDNIILNNQRDGIYLANSSYNTISNNIVQNNYYGIAFHWAETGPEPCTYNDILYNRILGNSHRAISLSLNHEYNNIIGNTIEYNQLYGIKICCSGDNNIIYHNNFLANTQSAEDGDSNVWDNGYPSGGNYWDDYNGTDENSDGIGDTPYHIPGGNNTDRYPLMKPWDNKPPATPKIDGPAVGKPRVEYDFTFSTEDPEDNNISYYIEWGDGTYTGWTYYFLSGENVTFNHTWNKIDNYVIRCKTKDIFGDESQWGTLDVKIPRNKATFDSWFQWFLEQLSIFKRVFYFRY